jgi:uncharacterized protein YndB with AHSA1/START domain
MDVTASRQVRAPSRDVADVMFDPRRDPDWIGGAESVELLSADPTARGARVRRHGGFLGKKFSWETEVIEHQPERLLRMRFIEGPMKGGDVTYRIEPSGDTSMVSIRNIGPGLPGMGWFVRRSVAKDLDRLAALVGRS